MRKKQFQPIRTLKFAGSAVIVLLSSPVLAETYKECLINKMQVADDSLTLAEIRSICTKLANDTTRYQDALTKRFNLEKISQNNPFTILPHKPNYLLPLSFSTKLDYKELKPEEDSMFSSPSQFETKFQFSVKAPLAEDIFNTTGDIYVAYTNTSWWQAYSTYYSSPFRETNHEPEVFFSMPLEQNLLGITLRGLSVGASHQSNGRAGLFSRSWNRLYANFIFQKNNFFFALKPWWRIPESRKTDPGDHEADDNPDIARYMGYGELILGSQIDVSTIEIRLRNNLRKENKGAIQIGWSFPINNRFKAYIQFFNGYGESLLDYNKNVTRLSLGVMLTDWL